ncbi:MAG: DUF6339 family protein [Ignavibacteria bacterium]
MKFQNIFRTEYVEHLRRGVKDGSLIKYYESDTFLYDNEKILQFPVEYYPENIKLIIPNNKSNYDFENSKIIYESYKSLTPLQASDIRLWTYLSHIDYFEYMSKRWPSIKEHSAVNPSKYILDHWFIPSPSQSNFLRHGIAGLWWVSYLTYDENRTDHYELTKVIYRQLDFATRTLGTYSLARHKEAVFGILEFILDNSLLFANNFEAKSRYITKLINQLGGIRPLSYFEKDYFKGILINAKDRIGNI